MPADLLAEPTPSRPSHSPLGVAVPVTICAHAEITAAQECRADKHQMFTKGMRFPIMA
jgi:hypothetical protein